MSEFMEAVERQTEEFDPARRHMIRCLAQDWEDLRDLARENIELLQGGTIGSVDHEKKVQTLIHQQVGEYKSLSVQIFRMLKDTGVDDTDELDEFISEQRG